MSAFPLPGSPEAPKFWRDESTGVLAAAVMKYLRDQAMTLRDIAVMRAYLRQWMASPVWDMNPSHDQESREELARLRRTVETIQTGKDVRRWLRVALDAGIDPL